MFIELGFVEDSFVEIFKCAWKCARWFNLKLGIFKKIFFLHWLWWKLIFFFGFMVERWILFGIIFEMKIGILWEMRALVEVVFYQFSKVSSKIQNCMNICMQPYEIFSKLIFNFQEILKISHTTTFIPLTMASNLICIIILFPLTNILP